jgi:hypothetical protein
MEREVAVRYEINNGDYVGSAEWVAPGNVALYMDDPRERAFFERYFSSEDSHLVGPVESAEMTLESPDESEEAFRRSAFRLTAYSYRVAPADGEQEGGAGGTSEASMAPPRAESAPPSAADQFLLPPGFPPHSKSEEPFRATRSEKERNKEAGT